MNLESLDINYLWAVVGGLVYFAIGALWYSPFVLADRWLAAQGKSDVVAGSAQPPVSALAMNLVGSVVMALVVAAVYGWAGGDGVLDGIVVSLVVSVGVVAMEALKGIAYYQQTLTLYAINTGYAVVGLGVAGAIYGALA